MEIDILIPTTISFNKLEDLFNTHPHIITYDIPTEPVIKEGLQLMITITVDREMIPEMLIALGMDIQKIISEIQLRN